LPDIITTTSSGNREARTRRGKVAESLAIVDPILTYKFKTIT